MKLEMIETETIRPANWQPRRNFPKEGLDELGQSIKGVGLIEPVVVRKKGNIFEIIAGERRYRAMEQGGFDKIPCVVRADGDTDAKIISLVENWHRAAVETTDNEKFIANLYEEGLKADKWRSYSDMERKTGIPNQIIGQILKAKEKYKEIQPRLRKDLTYKDFHETRPLEYVPNVRKKLLEKRAEKEFQQDELREISKKVSVLPTEEAQLDEIDRIVQRKKDAREYERKGLEEDTKIAKGERYPEVIIEEDKWKAFTDQMQKDFDKILGYGQGNISSLPKIHKDKATEIMVTAIGYLLQQLKAVNSKRFYELSEEVNL